MISKTRCSFAGRLTETVAALLLGSLLAGVPAQAQFKVVGPPPFSPAVAHQRIKALLEKIVPGNRQQTINTITGWLVWFRDPADDELIAAWKKDALRENLPETITALADARVASEVVAFSWRERRTATFTLAYAPMLGDLMLRFSASAKPVVDDLTGPDPPSLSENQQYAVCRILIDMPDVGTWAETGRAVLPRYREPAQTLLQVDQSEGSRDKRIRAQYWTSVLRSATSPAQQGQRTELRSSLSDQPAPTAAPRNATAPPARAVVATPAPVVASAVAPAAPADAKEGTLECAGDPIPKNGQYVFHNVPTVNRKFDWDRKIWDVKLEAGDGEAQNLILKNKSSKPQTSCAVHWSVIQ